VSSVDIVMSCEKALDCIEEREIPGHGKQWVFVKPIPTLSGLICKDCQACALCGSTARDEVRHQNKRIKACVSCTDICSVCQQAKLRHHICCVAQNSNYQALTSAKR
jgi:hypothetical protein